MRRYFMGAALGISAVFLVVPVLAAAQSTDTPKPGTESTLQSRVEARKQQVESLLSVAEQATIQLKCTAAQELLGGVSSKAVKMQQSRTSAYGDIVARLTTLQNKLSASSVDTQKLSAQVSELKTKIAAFTTTTTTYVQAIDDVAKLGCQSDVEGFVATLSDARKLQSDSKNQSAQIRTYIQDTIKPSLQAIRAQLNPGDV